MRSCDGVTYALVFSHAPSVRVVRNLIDESQKRTPTPSPIFRLTFHKNLEKVRDLKTKVPLAA